MTCGKVWEELISFYLALILIFNFMKLAICTYTYLTLPTGARRSVIDEVSNYTYTPYIIDSLSMRQAFQT